MEEGFIFSRTTLKLVFQDIKKIFRVIRTYDVLVLRRISDITERQLYATVPNHYQLHFKLISMYVLMQAVNLLCCLQQAVLPMKLQVPSNHNPH